MTDTIYSIIDEGLTIDGNLTSSGAFEICGTITGNVKVDEVIVAVGGLISGDISARVATVFGTVEGNVIAERLTLKPSSVVKGDVESNELSIETGAQISGQMKVNRN